MRIGLGHGFLAIAAASLAILSLTYGDFAPSGRSLPGWIPWRETWVYLSALLLLAASAGLCFPRGKAMAASDFFTVEVWSRHGLITHYVLFVIELATRRVVICGITTNPNEVWSLARHSRLTRTV